MVSENSNRDYGHTNEKINLGENGFEPSKSLL